MAEASRAVKKARLIDAQEKKEGQRRQHKQRRDGAATVQRFIQEQLRTLTPDQLDGKVIDGLTCRQYVERHLDSNKGAGGRAKKKFIEHVLQLFGHDTISHASGSDSSGTQNINPILKKALVLLSVDDNHRRTYKPFQGYLSTAAAPTLLEFSVIVHMAMKLRPHTDEGCTLLIDVLKFVVRHDFFSTWPDKVSTNRDQIKMLLK